MKIFSITRGEWVTATPDVDNKTNKIVGFTVEGQDAIEPPELFLLPGPIDWERVRIQAAMNVLSGLVHAMKETPERCVLIAVDLADKLIYELKDKSKQ